MKKLWIRTKVAAQRVLTGIRMIKIISAYEFRRLKRPGLISSKRDLEERYDLLETHIILFPWLSKKIDFQAMAAKMRLDLVEKGADCVVVRAESYIGQYQTLA